MLTLINVSITSVSNKTQVLRGLRTNGFCSIYLKIQTTNPN